MNDPYKGLGVRIMVAVEIMQGVPLWDAEDVIPYMGLVEHNTTA